MINDLITFCDSKNFTIPTDKISLDQKIQRFDRHGKSNGWIVSFQNEGSVVAVFGDWKTGEKYTFSKNGKKDNVIFKKFIENKEHDYLYAAEQAQIFWDQCSDNQNSDYLTLKKIKSHGCKTYLHNGQRLLIVPMRDIDGKLWGYQSIGGDKRFGPKQKKKGNFHLIGDLSGKNIYVTEGYATGASVFEAINQTVAIAFDAGNLKSVCDELRKKYPNKKIIVAGDNDETGRKAAKEASKFYIFPKEEGKDFNDLPFEEIKKCFEKKKQRDVLCLGYNDDQYYFISKDKPTITIISSGSFSKNKLLDLMPLGYWMEKYPDKKGIDEILAYDNLMSGCRAAGRFSPKNIRGSGVWQDEGRTVYNAGDFLFVDGEKLSFTDIESKFIYVASEKTKEIVTPISTDEIKKLDLLIQKLSWKKESSPKLFLGWLFLSQVCGSIKWRPHIWVTGASGSGKTTVMNEVVGKLLSINCFKIMGRSTEAGIRQNIGSSSLPILFDENETTDKSSQTRVSNVIELFRQASSESDSHVVKGTSSGKSMSFNVRFAAIISSIRVNLTLEQDVNRFSVLEMIINKDNNFMGKGGTREQINDLLTDNFCNGFFSKSVESINKIHKNYEIFSKVLLRDNSSRFADQYGMLLAGYMAAIQEKPVTEKEAEQFTIDLSEHQESSSIKDENECLEFILNKKIIEGGFSYTVGEICDRLRNKNEIYEKHEFLNSVLEHNGLQFLDGYLIVQFKNPELSNMFKDSKWPMGWASALLRIDGAMSKSVRFSGFVKQCVCIKIN